MEASEAVAVAASSKQQSGGNRAGGGPAPFLTKTHQMVEEPSTDEVISWAEQGRSFVVWKPVELARDLLPLHFKHCNFSSFVRQLNTYGFRKVVPDRWEFANDNFRRGEQGLLSGIRRRKSTTPQSSKQSGGSAVNVAFPPPLPPAPPASATTSGGNERSSSSASSPPRADLTSENEQLKKDNHTLATELAQARRHCEELLGFLSRFLDVRQLDLGMLMQEDVVRAAGDAHQQCRAVADQLERGGEEGKGVKLFGVLLKDAARKRGRCEEAAASERPIKMIRIGEPWVGVPSSGPGRFGGEN
ncbi:Heat stress transcription factor B-1 [Dichanthelium oligosanthes]|uniref:Heat stress transcription factor B-1 n=1 Tax=Dichanthelium oligosanthes TaxID=888268 RepID=A0A1E5VP74_9POAL|nr:Heat stress transcription factor B-1 [Dichanthelium oligosanthes]